MYAWHGCPQRQRGRTWVLCTHAAPPTPPLQPGELLEKEVNKVPGAFAKVPGALKRIAWATPACVALERLPTFEQLCTRAWCITTCTDSGVAQYLRVHPTAATWPVGPGVAVPEPTDDTVLGRTAAS